jgi:serine/threonine protein kinase
MAENIEQRLNDAEKFYFNAGIIGKGGMAKVHKLVFNPYLYYNEILNDGNDYASFSKMFEGMTQEQMNEVYEDAEKDAQKSNDTKLLGLLERRVIAVKELTMNDEKITPRFRKEIELLVNPDFKHPNIVEGYGWIPPKGEDGVKLLMEYIDAIPIDDIKKDIPIPVNVYVATKIADALQFCHSKNILHRDVKPLNILVELNKQYSPSEGLTENERSYEEINAIKKVKLSDFGIVKLLGNESASNTVAGELIGTPKFYAPECVLLGIKEFDKKSEVFTLCATLYDLLCNIAPIQSVLNSEITDTINIMMTLHSTPDFVFPREYNPKISKLLQNVIMMGLAKDPNERPSIGGIKWFLEHIIKSKKCIHDEESLEEKTRIINNKYLEAKRTQNPTAYWNLSNLLLQIPGKEEQTIDALSKTIEFFKQLPKSQKNLGYVSMCEHLLLVEKRSLNAPKRKIQEQKNNIEQKQ